VPEFIISSLEVAARANFKSLDPARLRRIEGSRADFSIALLCVPVQGCAEVPAEAP
jgi:hypothetical protein